MKTWTLGAFLFAALTAGAGCAPDTGESQNAQSATIINSDTEDTSSLPSVAEVEVPGLGKELPRSGESRRPSDKHAAGCWVVLNYCVSPNTGGATCSSSGCDNEWGVHQACNSLVIANCGPGGHY